MARNRDASSDDAVLIIAMALGTLVLGLLAMGF